MHACDSFDLQLHSMAVKDFFFFFKIQFGRHYTRGYNRLKSIHHLLKGSGGLQVIQPRQISMLGGYWF